MVLYEASKKTVALGALGASLGAAGYLKHKWDNPDEEMVIKGAEEGTKSLTKGVIDALKKSKSLDDFGKNIKKADEESVRAARIAAIKAKAPETALAGVIGAATGVGAAKAGRAIQKLFKKKK